MHAHLVDFQCRSPGVLVQRLPNPSDNLSIDESHGAVPPTWAMRQADRHIHSQVIHLCVLCTLNFNNLSVSATHKSQSINPTQAMNHTCIYRIHLCFSALNFWWAGYTILCETAFYELQVLEKKTKNKKPSRAWMWLLEKQMHITSANVKLRWWSKLGHHFRMGSLAPATSG